MHGSSGRSGGGLSNPGQLLSMPCSWNYSSWWTLVVHGSRQGKRRFGFCKELWILKAGFSVWSCTLNGCVSYLTIYNLRSWSVGSIPSQRLFIVLSAYAHLRCTTQKIKENLYNKVEFQLIQVGCGDKKYKPQVKVFYIIFDTTWRYSQKHLPLSSCKQ